MPLSSTIRDLHRRKARERRALALAEGVRLVEEMLAARVPCKGAVVSPALETTPRGAALVSALAATGAPIESVSDAELADLAATEHPQGVVAVYEPRAWTLDDVTCAPGRPVVILDGVQDPGNVGTIARTALALGASGLVALPGTADLTNPKVVRSAMGALFRLPHLHADDVAVATWLETEAIVPWVTMMQGDPIPVAPPDECIALVLGNEGAGVRPEWEARAGRRVLIPIRDEAESLNVAVAAGILLHLTGAR
ncbi:MAG TPA: RNA methyltransferase [Gemmatimonadales bacterium]|nr:RNA methyltransferase [Gemmatimonadales bacterium]